MPINMTDNNFFKLTSLHKSVISILLENNFEIMTDVQDKTIPYLCKFKDVIVQSQTGTGKTLAFVLPIVSTYYKMESTYKNHPICLVISPTRELALQITDSFVSYFRSYKEHKLNYLLDYTTLNYDELKSKSKIINENIQNFDKDNEINLSEDKNKKKKSVL
ncbi:atp-dependent rna helicase [Vairimorpha apis BRL 01]|uniref:ATP-dependent RNA helicase n=1 Tax=Vairimorpha apis BRL 01 TaxID=1037528 RepID=T0LCX8_9MICR|nr:atp-dependent rna helicase [Vairimorpha apis BRL 01]